MLIRILAIYLCLFSFDAFATIARDGTPQTTNGTVSTLQAPTGFSPSGTTDEIIVWLSNAVASGSAGTVSGVSGCGLTWSFRSGSLRFGNTIDQEEWAATSTSSLTNCRPIATWTGGSSFQNRIYIEGYSGINTSQPFDPNASVPIDTAFMDSTLNITGTITTNVANDMIIGFVYVDGGYGTLTRPSSFTQIVSGSTSSDISDHLLSGTVSGANYQWSWTTSSIGRGLIVDVLQPAGTGPSGNNTIFMSFPR